MAKEVSAADAIANPFPIAARRHRVQEKDGDYEQEEDYEQESEQE